jgi:hypothetical protein
MEISARAVATITLVAELANGGNLERAALYASSLRGSERGIADSIVEIAQNGVEQSLTRSPNAPLRKIAQSYLKWAQSRAVHARSW